MKITLSSKYKRSFNGNIKAYEIYFKISKHIPQNVTFRKLLQFTSQEMGFCWRTSDLDGCCFIMQERGGAWRTVLGGTWPSLEEKRLGLGDSVVDVAFGSLLLTLVIDPSKILYFAGPFTVWYVVNLEGSVFGGSAVCSIKTCLWDELEHQLQN